VYNRYFKGQIMEKSIDWFKRSLIVVVVITVLFCVYRMGVYSNRDALCDQVGGVYVSGYTGNRCIIAKEIPLP
jgi:hypothetical protein